MKIRRDRSIGLRRTAIVSIEISIQKDLGSADTIGRRCTTLNDSNELRTFGFGQINKMNFIHADLYACTDKKVMGCMRKDN